jgi:hypothetical protein
LAEFRPASSPFAFMPFDMGFFQRFLNLYFDKIVELTGYSLDETEDLKEELYYLLLEMYDEVAAYSGNYPTITVYDTSAKKILYFEI